MTLSKGGQAKSASAFTPPTRKRAKRDTYFERPEIGDGVFTFIPAGEEIPAELEDKRGHDTPVAKKAAKLAIA